MRLNLANGDFGRTQIVSKKLSAKLLNDESFEDIKITFNEYMIQYYMQKEQFMDIFRAYNSVYNTSLVKNDSARAVEVLAKACSFLVLAQHDNEQHDFLHRLRDDSNMEKVLNPHFGIVTDSMQDSKLAQGV